jgi:hypothetical protein
MEDSRMPLPVLTQTDRTWRLRQQVRVAFLGCLRNVQGDLHINPWVPLMWCYRKNRFAEIIPWPGGELTEPSS